MRENEEAALNGTQSGSGQMNFDGFDLPDVEFITIPAAAQPGIERFLLYGRENALPVRELERLTGLRRRQISKAVQDARRHGVPVLATANPGGYYLAATEDEKAQCIRSLRHRENETRLTRICLEYARVNQ